jgi:hypothetical protein
MHGLGIPVEYIHPGDGAAMPQGAPRVIGTPGHAVAASIYRSGRPVTGFEAAIASGALDGYTPGTAPEAPANGRAGRMAATAFTRRNFEERAAQDSAPTQAPGAEAPAAFEPAPDVLRLPGRTELRARMVRATGERVIRRVAAPASEPIAAESDLTHYRSSDEFIVTTPARSPFSPSQARREPASSGPKHRRPEAGGRHRASRSRLRNFAGRVLDLLAIR